MKHTFLFEEGLWVAKGEYADKDNKVFSMEGSTRTTHKKDLWVNEGLVTVLVNNQPVEFRNRYEIMPFEKGKDFTFWQSTFPQLGKFFGRFMVVDDTLISTFVSDSGEYSGNEYIIKVSDINYRNRGFIFRNDEKLSSWATELVKVNQRLH